MCATISKVTCFICLFFLLLLGHQGYSQGTNNGSNDAIKTIKYNASKHYKNSKINFYKIHGDSIADSGISLNKGWKFNLTNDMNFSKTEFDDSQWNESSIDKTFSSYQINESQLAWFRKKINVDSSMLSERYVLKIENTGPLEIYLDGNLIHEIGKIEDKISNCEFTMTTHGFPYPITFNKVGDHVLAIRFLFLHQNTINKSINILPLDVRLMKNKNILDKQVNKVIASVFIAALSCGFFFMMSFVHFFFYFFFDKQKFNLLFGIAMLMFGFDFWLSANDAFFHSINGYTFNVIASEILFVVGHIVLLAAVYNYLKLPLDFFFYIIAACFIGILGYEIFVDYEFAYGNLLYLFLLALYVYIISKAFKVNPSNAAVLRNAAIVFMILLLMVFIGLILFTIFMEFNSKNAQYNFITFLLPAISLLISVGPQLSISASISWVLARDYVATNKKLAEKLNEVQKLSTEKQAILANQNIELEKQVNERTSALNTSLEELKAAQSQLIQAEKMASLGELTAGIAHEIKNPLNFVNNFAELNSELLLELKEEIEKNEIPNALALIDDINGNMTKIVNHGKRADDIVKSMLEHSRSNTAQKEVCDINKLTTEYLNLAYHGMRAKDKNFNVKMNLNLDEKVGKINIVQQEISRVLLNLFTNAFYAVNVRKQNTSNFEPRIDVFTFLKDNNVEIHIKDNGIGISQSIIDKIFQPFFTTKPTGQGTGLGLSLSYDIVQAHGGTIKVVSVEGEGTEMIVVLPIDYKSEH